VMNANKVSLACLFAVVLGLFLSATAQAEEKVVAIKAAPALYGVKEFQVQYGRVGNQAASANCGTSSGELATMVLKSLKSDGLPAFPVLGAQPVSPGVARIDIFPDIVTLQPRDKECVSWVSITAQSKDVLRVYPVETPRNLLTTYWTGGLMISSSQSGHPTSLNDAIAKLTAALSRQYRLDQPPTLTPQDAGKQAQPQIGQ